jgi:hypothetical protein
MSRRGGGSGQASCAALPGACFSLLCAPRCDDGSALALASLLVLLAGVLTAGWTGLVVGALRTQAQRECAAGGCRALFSLTDLRAAARLHLPIARVRARLRASARFLATLDRSLG